MLWGLQATTNSKDNLGKFQGGKVDPSGPWTNMWISRGGEEQTTGSRTKVYCYARSWRPSVILAISKWTDGACGRCILLQRLGLWCLLSLDVKYTYRFLICIFLGYLDVFYFDGIFSRFWCGDCVLVFGIASGAFVVAIYHVSIPYNQDLYILSGML